MTETIKNRYDFVMLIDCTYGNPNGDPDANNMPRVDPETGIGLITDVCIKRKIRDYVDTVRAGEKGYGIYIKSGSSLQSKDQQALDYIRTAKVEKGKESQAIIDFMTSNYFDIRTFGAVMTTFSKKPKTDEEKKAAWSCGQVTGPVQITFAQSIDPVTPMDLSVSRCAVTTEEDAEQKASTFGNKPIIPYGLYRAEGYISAALAEKVTGFSEDDLELLWEAINGMFDTDHAAARGKMVLRDLIVFKHDNKFGCCPSHKLFDLVDVHKKDSVEFPRSYSDYVVTIDEEKIPEGVHLEHHNV